MNGSIKHRRFAASLAFALALLSPAGSLMAQSTAEQVQAFVRQVYIEGVPFEQASRLDPAVALPVLQQVLADRSQQEYWANAAVIAGMIGADRSADILIEFVTRPEPSRNLPRAQVVAKTSAVMALGYVVNKSRNRKALDFLSAGVDPAAWNNRNVKWTGAHLRTATERNQQLATMAVLGLGVSGTPEAARVLRMLTAPPASPRIRALKSRLPGVETVADEALKANAQIASEGIDRYYLRVQPRRPVLEDAPSPPPRVEMEVLKPPVAGEVIKPLTPGEVLREPRPGEQVGTPKTGTVLRPLTKGQVIEPPRQQ